MADPISNRIVEQAADQAMQRGASQSQPQPRADVNQADQAAFENALNAETTVDQIQSVGQVGEAADKTIGDAMLDGLEQMKSSIDSHSASIEQQLNRVDGNMSVQDTMKLQVELMQMHLEQESIVKIGDKTSQGVQTMFKADK